MAVGKRGDLVILEARSGHEAIVGQARELWALKNGRPVASEGRLLIDPTD